MSAVREWAASQNSKVLEVAFLLLQLDSLFHHLLPSPRNQSISEIHISNTDGGYLIAGCGGEQFGEMENGNTNDRIIHPSCLQRSKVVSTSCNVHDNFLICCLQSILFVSWVQSVGARRYSCFRCRSALYFCWACSMVLNCVHAKDLECTA